MFVFLAIFIVLLSVVNAQHTSDIADMENLRDAYVEMVTRLEQIRDQLQKTTHAGLTPWQRVQLARHPQRPYTLDYINMLM